MTDNPEFNGFPKQCISFFRNLKKNNTKEWFADHRGEYDEHVLAPSRAFVVAMGDRLKDLSPYVHAESKVNRSLFRIHRDIRFSKDKSPYKTHMGIWFWEGSRQRMECSGYYFHVDPPNLLLGVGIYMFPKPMMKAYRDSVVHPEHGPALAKAVDAVTGKDYKPGGRHYKRVPSGYDVDHENAEYLLYNGFHMGAEKKIPAELHSPELVEYCFERYREMYPVHQWLLAMTKRM